MTDQCRATEARVRQFLDHLASVPSGRMRFMPRADRDYRQDLVDLGLREVDAKNIVYGLTVENYSDGPETQRGNHEHEVWFFGYDVAGVEAYIKLRVITNLPNQDPRGLILSFHEAEHSLEYPYRNPADD